MSFNLLQLLSTLNGAEKRYCHLYLKTFSNKDTPNKILSDFNLLQRIAKKPSSPKKFITEGNSTRLYYKLLDALFMFHQDSILPDEKQLIRRARVLYSKGFNNEALKITEKILNQNPQTNHLIKIEVIELRMLSALKTSDLNYLKNNFSDDKKKLETLSKEYFNLLEYEGLWASFRLESTNSYFFGEKGTIKSKLLQNEEKAISPAAKVLYNKVKGFVAVKEGDYPAANFYANRAKFLYEQYPYLIKKDPGDYLRSLSNMCLALMFNKMYSEAEVILNDFQNHSFEFYKSKNVDVLTEYFKLKVLLRLVLFISAGKILDNFHEIKEHDIIFNELYEALPLDEKLNTHLSFSIFYINSGDYRKALKHINFVLKNAEKFRKDIFHLGLITELCVHYMNNNIDLLESKLNSFKRYINTNESPFSFEKELPHLLGKILQAPEEKLNYSNLHQAITKSLETENKMVYKNFIPLYLITYRK